MTAHTHYSTGTDWPAWAERVVNIVLTETNPIRRIEQVQGELIRACGRGAQNERRYMNRCLPVPGDSTYEQCEYEDEKQWGWSV